MTTESFFGKYRLIERLGFGGMAEVFRAVLTGAEGFYRELAIKRIRPELSGNPEFERMFIDEARIAAKLQHANIVQIFDFDRIGSFTYIVMEYVRGQDLASVLSRGKHLGQPMPIDVACHVALEFLAGLRYAHEKSEGTTPLDLIHRDISPGNVLMSYEGEVKLTDFGIAKAIISVTQTRTGEMKGKYSYMSPEQVRQEQLDQRSDLFSAGTVLYEMLTCERAFRDESDFATLERIVHGNLQPPRTIRSDIPPALERLVLKATSVDPDERFQNASEMLRALEDVCRQAGLHTSTESLRTYLRALFPDEIAKEPEIFFGKYRLVQRLGGGNRTEVYRALFTGAEEFHQELAIKRLRPGPAQDTELNERFLEAARALPRLQHANIVQVFDADRVGNYAYLAMEYVEATSLEAVLDRAAQRDQPVPLEVALHVVLEVLAALRYAHGKHGARGPVFHGDISPRTVLLTSDGEIKLVDFGLGDAFIGQATPGELNDIWAHRAPEQVDQREVDTRADLFSVGALLLRMVAGLKVFRGLDPHQVQTALGEAPGVPDHVDTGVRRELATLIASALATDPAARPQDAAGMRIALYDLGRAAGLDPSAPALCAFLEALCPEDRSQAAPADGSAYAESTPDMRDEPTPGQIPSRMGKAPRPVPPKQDARDSTRSDLPASPPETVPSIPGGRHPPPSDQAPPPFFPLGPASTPGRPAGDEVDVTPVQRPRPPGLSGEKPAAAEGPPAPRPPRSAEAGAGRRPPWTLWLAVLAVVAAMAAGLWILWPRQPGGAADSGTIRVLMRSLPPIEQWYRRNVFDPFEQSHGVRIQTVRYNTIDEIPALLADPGNELDLVKVHLALSRVLVEQERILPVETVLNRAGRGEELARLAEAFVPLAFDLSRIRTAIQNPVCYLPRKLETNFIAYRPSRVREAVDNWASTRDALEGELERLTGHGLPEGYQLESDPARWDSYDLLVVHHHWAHTPGPDGRTQPRVARRTYPYWGSYLEFMDELAGMDVAGRLELDASAPCVDLFSWLALYRELGLYHPQVWSGEMNVTGSVIYDLLARGEIYWVKLHSLAALELVGSKESGFPSRLGEPDELAFTRIPRRVSLQLDPRGRPARAGSRRTVVTGWFWGIPAGASHPVRSYELAAWMTSREIHAREVGTFVIQPIRKDVRLDTSPLGQKLAPLIEAQMQANHNRIVPRAASAGELQAKMTRAGRAWEEIVLKRSYLRNGRISRGRIRARLEALFPRK